MGARPEAHGAEPDHIADDDASNLELRLAVRRRDPLRPKVEQQEVGRRELPPPTGPPAWPQRVALPIEVTRSTKVEQMRKPDRPADSVTPIFHTGRCQIHESPGSPRDSPTGEFRQQLPHQHTQSVRRAGCKRRRCKRCRCKRCRCKRRRCKRRRCKRRRCERRRCERRRCERRRCRRRRCRGRRHVVGRPPLRCGRDVRHGGFP